MLPCCCETTRAEASKRLAELTAAYEHSQDALLKVEQRAARAEAERQRCEHTLESIKQKCAECSADAEARISEAEKSATSRVAEAEKSAKQLREQMRQMELGLQSKEEQMRKQVDIEMQTKYAQEFRIAQRAHICVLQGVEWQYEYHGRWCAFDAKSSEQLLRLYLQYASSQFDVNLSIATVSSGSHEYKIEFVSMQQTNVMTLKVRSVRVKCDMPDSWQKPAETLMWQPSISQMNTQEDCTEAWDAAERLLHGTAHAATGKHAGYFCCQIRTTRITSLRRVENHLLWRRYQQHVAEMEIAQAQAGVKADGVLGVQCTLAAEFEDMLNELSGHNFQLNKTVNERWLLHGTDTDTVDKIVEGGFDLRVSGTSGFYGAGTYFSSQSCKCHQYTSGPERTMLLCRVALGVPFCARAVVMSMRRTPPIRQDSQQLHGCIVANEGPMAGHHDGHQAHQEFVIFDGAQAFPVQADGQRTSACKW